MKEKEWSQFQLDVFDAIREDRENLLIDAVAGSGKTTTIVEGMRHVPKDGVVRPTIYFLAFNRRIADTLQTRVPEGTFAATFHKLGFASCRRGWKGVKMEVRKCTKIFYRIYTGDPKDYEDFRAMMRLVGLTKSCWPQPSEDEVLAFVSQHGLLLDEPEKAVELSQRICKESLKDRTLVDFDDMLLHPVAFNLPVDSPDYLFIDEAQDTNSIQLQLLRQLQASRYVFVGDPNQAIYGFRGAGVDSMERIQREFRCRELPLSVSYRCSKAAVAEAQKYYTKK